MALFNNAYIFWDDEMTTQENINANAIKIEQDKVMPTKGDSVSFFLHFLGFDFVRKS